MNFEAIFFVVLSALALAGGFMAVTFKNLMHAGLSLGLTMVSVSGLFLMLDADFLAMVQVLLYTGGVLTLVLFVVMMTEGMANRRLIAVNEQQGWGLIASVLFFLLISAVFLKDIYAKLGTHEGEEAVVGKPTSALLGRELMSTHLLPFEVASLMLLAALIGGILLTRDVGGEESR